MKPLVSFFLVLFFTLMQSQAVAQLHRAEKVYSKVSAAVVQILTYDERGKQIGQASGVYFKEQNCIVTNYHVRVGAFEVRAQHAGMLIKLEDYLNFDEQKDILIYKVGEPLSEEEKEYRRSIPQLKYAEVKDLKIGERIYAIGSPRNLENTISEGLVSGLRPSKDSLSYLIQITAPFSSGSSGGAVVDAHGNLIGITTFILTGHQAQNLNFAISIDEVLTVFSPESIQKNISMRFGSFVNMAHKFMNDGNYSQAILNFHAALKLQEPPNNGVYFYLGECFRHINNFDSAIRYYAKALSLQPDARTNLALASIFEAKEDHSSSFFYYNEAFKIDSSSPEALIGLLNHYLAADSTKQVSALTIQLAAVAETSFDANMLLGDLSLKAAEYDIAIILFNAALRLNPNSGGAYFGLMQAYQKKGDDAKANEYMLKAFQVDPALKNVFPILIPPK